MENEPELIRDQMQDTRTALADKLDSLQQKVSDTVESITTPVTETVQSVKDAVSDTVESVRDTVSGTVESVKDTFNLPRHVENYPWPMMAGSFAVGYLLGRVLPSPFPKDRAKSDVAAGMTESAQARNGPQRLLERRREEEPARAEDKGGMLSGLAGAVGGELDKLKGLAVGAGVGLLRDLATQSLTGEMGGRIKEWMDGLTQSLGGKPFKEPLITPPEETDARQGHTGDPQWSSSRQNRPQTEAARR